MLKKNSIGKKNALLRTSCKKITRSIQSVKNRFKNLFLILYVFYKAKKQIQEFQSKESISKVAEALKKQMSEFQSKETTGKLKDESKRQNDRKR